MALNFPNNPGIGSVYTDSTSGFSYQWNGTVWQSYSSATASNIQILDDISSSFNGSTLTFTLTSGGTAVYPVNAQQLDINLGGVIQSPGVDYTISSSNITFTGPAPTAGLTFSGKLLGTGLSLSTISDGLVTPVKLSTGGPTWNTGGDLRVTGVVTAVGGFNIGIQSAGLPITTGVITAINFVGVGNTLQYNSATKTVDVSIAGGGGGGGSGLGTALSNVEGTLLNEILYTHQTFTVTSGITTIEAPAGSGGIAFTLLGTIVVSSGATVQVASGTTFITDVLGIFTG